MTSKPCHTVLIVDDQPIIRTTLQKIFARAGYEARTAASAEEAHWLILEGEWIPNLMILDVHLRGMSGVDLAILLKQICPECRVILFSGQSNTSHLLEKAAGAGYTFPILAKPSHPDILLEFAGNLLDQGTKAHMA